MGFAQDGVWSAGRKEEGEEKGLDGGGRAGVTQAAGCDLQGSHGPLKCVTNTPEQGQHSQGQGRQKAQGERGICALSESHELSPQPEIVLFLMYCSLQDYKVGVPTRGEGR